MNQSSSSNLNQKLWDIANDLRGNMGADEFRDYILGFIFYKYLSERMHLYANRILQNDNIQYTKIDEGSEDGKAYLDAIKEESLEKLGYFLKPSELFTSIALKSSEQKDSFI